MASDLGLHCLPMSHKKDARLIYGLNQEEEFIVHNWLNFLGKRIYMCMQSKMLSSKFLIRKKENIEKRSRFLNM